MRRHSALVLAVVAVVFGVMAAPALAQKAPRKAAGPLTVTSPGGVIIVTIGTDSQLTWSVSLRGREILKPSRIAMTLDGGRVLGDKPVVSATAAQAIDRVLKPTVRTKRAEVRDRCNERRVDFAGGYSLVIRAYDDGVAYRWLTKLPGDITVVSEDVTLTFAEDQPLYFPEETSFQSHQERQYKRLKISELKPGQFSSLPAMADLGGGVKAVLTEADLFDYPGMDLTAGACRTRSRASFPRTRRRWCSSATGTRRSSSARTSSPGPAAPATSPGASWLSPNATLT